MPLTNKGWCGPSPTNQVSVTELEGARFLGGHVAQIAGKLKA